jgi:7,8-dihydropterin-6-yl-methyl-4-(beta-D-ribofuranosyl)aminobenzene 5'-phosphate synthase
MSIEITALVENTSCDPRVGAAHGLSLAIEGCGKRILFDTGPSDLLEQNAQALQVDLSAFDLAVISHGHYDHGGGLHAFLAANHTAPVYVSEFAFGPFYSEREDGTYKYIGLDRDLVGHPQIVTTGPNTVISGQARLFAGAEGDRFTPKGNARLRKQVGTAYLPDDFAHEQSLVMEEDGICLLTAGCAHLGIANIIERCKTVCGHYPTHVVGGFHLSGNTESAKTLSDLGKYLLSTGAMFYTCHCTGEESYEILRKQMGDRIQYLPGGRHVTIGKKENER